MATSSMGRAELSSNSWARDTRSELNHAPGLCESRRMPHMTNYTLAPIRGLNPPELGTPPGYSQVVEVYSRRIIFIAGQTALNREGELIGKNDFAAQTAQVFRNLNVALE